ncbi:hypothetical protein B0T24DRAFT_151009 [Lasiosphaeria ovina]|uniref:Uncharacterized protein n=1 Tax=Lasiosphaeria ovina TaxID=92902 RepID=A0AAE0KN54_9PEZI|nr:hypothetical protein B0T24DRAFT_151009 [Lasiosphaeria ovina]
MAHQRVKGEAVTIRRRRAKILNSQGRLVSLLWLASEGLSRPVLFTQSVFFPDGTRGSDGTLYYYLVVLSRLGYHTTYAFFLLGKTLTKSWFVHTTTLSPPTSPETTTFIGHDLRGQSFPARQSRRRNRTLH